MREVEAFLDKIEANPEARAAFLGLAWPGRDRVAVNVFHAATDVILAHLREHGDLEGAVIALLLAYQRQAQAEFDKVLAEANRTPVPPVFLSGCTCELGGCPVHG